MGANKKPYYRADSRFPRDGRCIETIGTYDPKRANNPVTIQAERAAEWIRQGAQVTETVRSLLRQAKVPGIS